MTAIETQNGVHKAIPAGQLTLSPYNVRTQNSEEGIPELAALLLAEGILQNLVVHEEPSADDSPPQWAVSAGGRRWRAIRLLLEQGRMSSDTLIPCLVIPIDRAISASTTENSGRLDLHPADQFVAFKKMIDEGKSIEDVAARFGVEPIIVQRRLKLANVAPEFIEQYRKGKLTLQHLMAFAVTEDHGRQRQVWKSLKAYEREAHCLRRALTVNEVSTRDPMARFVGLAAYESAGGQVRRDLFAQEDETFLLDVELLRRLADEKLEKQAQKLKDEGVAWVETASSLDFADEAAYGRVGTIQREPTKKERTKLDALSTRRAELEKELDGTPDEDEEKLEALESEIEDLDDQSEKINRKREVPDPAQAALAGAVLAIGHDGKLRIERNRLKPEDAKRFSRRKKTKKEVGKEGAPTHTAALTRRLTAQRTLALQVVLAQQPDVALVALTHRLALTILYDGHARHASAVEIDARPPSVVGYGDELKECRAVTELDARRTALQELLPKDPDALFGWLAQLPQKEVLGVLAFCTAVCINGVQAHEEAGGADVLAQAASLDMRQWWTPTAQTYLASVPKAQVIAVVREAVSVEAAASLEKLKKAPLMQAAEQRLAGTGWLPNLLKTPAPVSVQH